MKVPRPAVKLPADSVPVKIVLAKELELIGYRVDALPTTSWPLQLTLWWRGVRPATEDWTAFFHFTPLGKDAELLGQMDQAITERAYPPTQIRVSVEAGTGVVSEDRARLLEFQLEP